MVYVRIFGEEFQVQLLVPRDAPELRPPDRFFFREISGQLDWIEFSMGFFQCFFQWDLPGHGVLKGVFQWESIGDSIGFHGNLNRKHH